MIPCHDVRNPKCYQESKLLQEEIHIKAKYQKHEFQIAENYSPSVSLKANSSLTQKDIMDRGA